MPTNSHSISGVSAMTKNYNCVVISPRRRFLQQSAVIGAALLLPQVAVAATVVQSMGEVLVNGVQAMRDTLIKAGDTVKTGAGATVIFVLGADVFMLRQMSSMQLENKGGALLINGLRLVTGAMLAVFGPGMRSVMTGFVTAAIRGTGIYVEASAEKTYFCTCYGEVGLAAADGTKKDVLTNNHSAHFIHAKAAAGSVIFAAPMMNHNNQELAQLEKLVGRVPRLKSS